MLFNLHRSVNADACTHNTLCKTCVLCAPPYSDGTTAYRLRSERRVAPVRRLARRSGECARRRAVGAQIPQRRLWQTLRVHVQEVRVHYYSNTWCTQYQGTSVP